MYAFERASKISVAILIEIVEIATDSAGEENRVLRYNSQARTEVV